MRSKMMLALAASLTLAGCANLQAEAKKENEGDEVKIKFSEAPAAVQATLKKESGNATIDSLDKETADGVTIYEADVMLDGQNYEIKVAESGKLISKAQDNEEAEKKDGKDKEKGEKGEKEEKK